MFQFLLILSFELFKKTYAIGVDFAKFDEEGHTLIEVGHRDECVCFRPDKISGGNGVVKAAEIEEAHNGRCRCYAYPVTNTRAQVQNMLEYCHEYGQDIN